jgi:hypothetical protein
MLQNFGSKNGETVDPNVRRAKTLLQFFCETKRFVRTHVMNAMAPTLMAVMADPAAIRVPTNPTVAPATNLPLGDSESYFFLKYSNGPDSIKSSDLARAMVHPQPLGEMQDVKTKQARRPKIFLVQAVAVKHLMVVCADLWNFIFDTRRSSSTQIFTKRRTDGEACGATPLRLSNFEITAKA